jgi:hypothetical protein
VAETKSREMSKHEFSIAYDGAALAIADVHSIDVQALAPALLAFGKLNRRVSNGDQVRRVASLAMKRSRSVDFTGLLAAAPSRRIMLSPPYSLRDAKDGKPSFPNVDCVDQGCRKFEAVRAEKFPWTFQHLLASGVAYAMNDGHALNSRLFRFCFLGHDCTPLIISSKS